MSDVFRHYTPTIKKFYQVNHQKQTLTYALELKEKYKNPHIRLSIWQVLDMLDKVVDESDPDTHLSQTQHAFQTAEALRKDGQPDWLVLMGLIHDLGKVLICFGEPQWSVVGDIFPVGCQFRPSIIFHEYFQDNPDNAKYDKYGLYQPKCGWNNMHFSFSHDWYLAHVLKDSKLPPEALFVIKYHSFYAAHQALDYHEFMDKNDQQYFPWLQLFQKYDLYSKHDDPLNIESLLDYYIPLVNKYLDLFINW